MKFIDIIILLLCFFSCNLNETANKNHIYIPSKNNNKSNFERANIKFSKLNFNFGIVNKDQVISRYITFKNDGKRDLVISNVKSSCGCTIANWPKNPIAPNNSDSLLLELNTSSLNGKIMKTVTIISNSKPNTKVITINAQIN
ncbi:DUF1573 domain-containing protein [Bacteroidota bacterium]|nr:DUF1573 domain-containing protein [Bacteroidota bacterium]